MAICKLPTQTLMQDDFQSFVQVSATGELCCQDRKSYAFPNYDIISPLLLRLARENFTRLTALEALIPC